MNEAEIARRRALRSLLLGTAGAVLAACGGKQPSASTTGATAAPAAEPATPASTAPAAMPESPASAPAAASGGPPASPATSTSLPLLDPKDPQAVALGYRADATTVDLRANPTYKPGQHCAVCVQYKGAAGDAQGPCTIFAGRAVNASGWCKAWAARPA